MGNRAAWWVAGVLVALSAALFFFARRTPSRALFDAATSASSRLTVGRLAGFPYAPRSAPSKSANLSHLRAAAASILADGRRDEHTAAVCALLVGRFADAVAALESLVAREPRNIAAWNDLAVARMEDGIAADDARAIAKALVAADAALAVESNSVPALFNRAVVLEALGLRFAATDAWQRYLAVETGSGWAAEARNRLEAAKAPTREEAWTAARPQLEEALNRNDDAAVQSIVARFPQDARMTLEAEYLPAWAEAVLTSTSPQTARLLARARRVAAALKKHNGDAWLDEAATKCKPALAAAFRLYGQGRADNLARRISESLLRMTEAEHLFAAAGNPMWLSAAYYRASALIDLGRIEESKEVAAGIGRALRPSDRSLLAHLYWLHARNTNDAGHHYDSLLMTRRAVALFAELGELSHATRLRIAEAAMLARLGRDAEAWQCRRIALADAAASGRWSMIEMAIAAIARDEVDGPDRDVARSLCRVQVAAPSTLPLMRFNGLLWQAYLDAASSEAVPDLASARVAAWRIPDAKQREDALDELRLAEAMALRRSDPVRTEGLLSRVITYRMARGLDLWLPSIYLERARIRRATASVAAAEDDLRDAIALIESKKGRIREDKFRDAFLGHYDEAYRELSDVLLARGDWLGAFEVAERSRARILLEKEERRAVPVAEMIADVPGGIVGAHFTSLPARTLLVIVERGRAAHRVIDVPETKIRTLRDQLLSDPDSVPAARALYDLLIAPLEDRLDSRGSLVIVPDEATAGLPFAALRDARGRFLVERVALAVAPAFTAMQSELPRLRPLTARAAIVADPAFSSTVFPRLDRLPAARQDALMLESTFRSTTTLVGEAATLAGLRTAVADCDVLHVAAHAFSNSRDASLSLIALAPAGGDEGLLYLDDIEALALRGRPLVVLATCQSASLGGGAANARSLAHAFLSAGSRAVLASLWNIEDERASELTTSFYERLAEDATLPDALRQAQLRALRTHPVREWAALQLLLGIEKNAIHVPLTR